jgi:hypothetical protein
MRAYQLRGLTRPRRSLAAVAAVAVLAAPLVAGRASAGTHATVRVVSYRGYSFEVPNSWAVIDLTGSATCVRFDRHAVYLGNPASDQACPSWLVGTTEAVLIQPGPASHDPSSIEDPVARLITVTAPRIEVTATFDSHPRTVDRILSSASLPAPVMDAPDPVTATAMLAAGSPRPAPVPLFSPFSTVLTTLMRPLQPQATVAPILSAKVAYYKGLGFDACTAPSAAYMRAWRRRSPYRAVGVYIGGSDEACAQPNLTRNWLKTEAAAGWHFMPMYVGPQAEFGELGRHPGHQGRAAANDAVARAERLGFGADTPIYYDMEAYSPGETNKAMRFLSAWTSEIHALGYSSGVYSSSSAAVTDLARKYSTHKYAQPDVIFDALWNGAANTADPVLKARDWADHHRVHQFEGNIAQSYGGDPMNIDQDYLNVKLAG